MVNKKLQNKFYSALESLKDGKNDAIIEALAAGAKASFEGLSGGEVTADDTHIQPKDEQPDSACINPDSCPKFLTVEKLSSFTHVPETEYKVEVPLYSMVAEAVTKLGNTINKMKTSDNAPLVESIMDGFNACFNPGK